MLWKTLLFWTFISGICSQRPLLAQQQFSEHGRAQMRHNPVYLHMASGSLYGRLQALSHRFPWPVQVLSIGHTIASYQKYSFSEAYFHHGIDIRADAGSSVRASRGGQVVNIENYVPGDPAYWEVAILDEDGFIWQYHHIERSSIPPEIYAAHKTGTLIPAGAILGKVYRWSVKTFGEYFHHIHLNIIGSQKNYQNPLLFLRQLPDTAAPTVKSVSLRSTNGLVGNTIAAGQPYTIVAEVEDFLLHAYFKIPPYHTWISLNGSQPHTVWKFDHLPGGASITDYLHQFYDPRLTCGDYRCRKSVINLGFYRGRQVPFPTTPGAYHLRIGVSDEYGNKSEKDFTWTVK